MFLENSYRHKNSAIHNLNPIIKFLVFISVIFLLFSKITFFSQLLLIGFVLLIVFYSDSEDILRKSISIYFFLVFFLFIVNWFFMKSPGFYTSNSLSSWRDVLGLDINQNTSDDTVKHGWFFGGTIAQKDGKAFIADSASCLEKALKGGNNNNNCGVEGHSHTISNLGSYAGSSKWRIIPLNVNGTTKYVAFLPTWYTFSEFQIVNAFSLANKIILIIILSSVFTITSSMSAFTYALEDLFRPLAIIKLPTKVMALATAISLRFAPSLISEAFRIIRAQASRGIDYKNGKFRDKLSALLSLFVPLFVISFIKSDELSAAMIARGYNPRENRTTFRVHTTRKWEFLVMFFSMFFVTVLYYLFFNNYYLSLIGPAEHLISIAR